MVIDMTPTDVSTVAAAIGAPSRAAMLMALARAKRLAATELAALAGVSASTASTHLAKLVRSRLVAAESVGRLRYFTLANPGVSRALEALCALSATTYRAASSDGAGGPDRVARMCYDHLAGRLGVELTQAMVRERFIGGDALRRRPTRGSAYDSTKKGVEFLRTFGIDPRAVRARPRSYAHACLDRTERRPHLAGSLGAALADRLLDLGWIEHIHRSRTLRITPAGRRGLKTTFGVEA
jgi:DNA-binding transcriptional ArsR family regulator